MKKILVIILTIALTFTLFTGCGKDKTEYTLNETKLAQDLIAKGAFETTLYQVKDEKVSNYIASDDCEKRIMFIGNGAYADAFGIFTAKDAKAASELEETITQYVEDMKDYFRDYNAKEVSKLDNALIVKKGKYVVFCIAYTIDSAKAVIDQAITPDESGKDQPNDKPNDNDSEDVLKDYYPKISTTASPELVNGVYKVGDAGFEAYTFVEKSAQNYANAVNTAASKLAGKADVYNIIVPTSTGIVLPDDLYGKLNSSNQKKALNNISKMLNPSVKFVNVYENLMVHRDEYIFFKSDHHWTQLGAYYAYLEFANVAGFVPNDISRYKTKSYSGFKGTFYSDLGKPSDLSEDTVKAYLPVSSNVLRYTTTGGQEVKWPIINDVSNYPSNLKYSTFCGGDNPYTVIKNESLTDGSSVLVVKDSFANCFIPFLVDHYETVYVIDSRTWSKSGGITGFVTTNNVDDVIFLHNLSFTRNSYQIGKLNDAI